MFSKRLSPGIESNGAAGRRRLLFPAILLCAWLGINDLNKQHQRGIEYRTLTQETSLQDTHKSNSLINLTSPRNLTSPL